MSHTNPPTLPRSCSSFMPCRPHYCTRHPWYMIRDEIRTGTGTGTVRYSATATAALLLVIVRYARTYYLVPTVLPSTYIPTFTLCALVRSFVRSRSFQINDEYVRTWTQTRTSRVAVHYVVVKMVTAIALRFLFSFIYYILTFFFPSRVHWPFRNV